MAKNTLDKMAVIIDAIIHCASTNFKKYGAKKTTVDEIASSLHMSKRTLYTYFPSKEAILRECAWREIKVVMDKFYDTIPTDSRADTILLEFCRFIFNDRIKYGKNGLFWGIYADDNGIKKSYVDAVKNVIHPIYEKGVIGGNFKPGDHVFSTEVVVGMILTAVVYFPLASEPIVMFNDTIKMIADTVAFTERTRVDEMG
jgi:AcrR family transcriptional regulator